MFFWNQTNKLLPYAKKPSLKPVDLQYTGGKLQPIDQFATEFRRKSDAIVIGINNPAINPFLCVPVS